LQSIDDKAFSRYNTLIVSDKDPSKGNKEEKEIVQRGGEERVEK
jgi:hypothetical protein